MTDSPLATALKTAVAKALAEMEPRPTKSQMATVLAAVDDVLDERGLGDANPGPFPLDSMVHHRGEPTVSGRVAKRVEENGELHTIGVRWEGSLEIAFHSPRELVAE